MARQFKKGEPCLVSVVIPTYNRADLVGRAGRAYVEANYDIDKLNDRLVEIYESLLDG